MFPVVYCIFVYRCKSLLKDLKEVSREALVRVHMPRWRCEGTCSVDFRDWIGKTQRVTTVVPE